MKLFQKLKSFFSSQSKQSEAYDGLWLQVQIPFETLDEACWRDWRCQTLQYIMLGYQIQETEPTEEIPPGCIGLMKCYYGGKLIYRQELRLEEEYFEKKIVVSERLSV